MNVKLSRCLLLGLLSCVSLAAPASAYMLVKLPLEKRVSASSLVVIGTVVRLGEIRHQGPVDAFHPATERYAHVRVVEVLKGSPRTNVDIVITSPIGEDRLDCCAKAGTYLFFLAPRPDGRFRVVNGRYGAISVTG